MISCPSPGLKIEQEGGERALMRRESGQLRLLLIPRDASIVLKRCCGGQDDAYRAER